MKFDIEVQYKHNLKNHIK